MEIEFCNLSYTVKTLYGFGETKAILHNVNGKFLSGEFIGILGPSGAGKTSLLHVLSGYKTQGISGVLLVNGNVRDERWFRRRSCYITQEELLPQCVTLHEAMHLAARLKISGDAPERERIMREILDWLGLTSAVDTRVERLSGGQRRRAALALELLARPPACVLDEPCSGLDDVAASRTLRLLRKLACAGRTVLVTMHQPSFAQLNQFHRIYMVAAGKCVYQGPPQAIVSFLARNGFECPTTHNPADFLMELVDCEANKPNIQKLSNALQNGRLSEPFPDPKSTTESRLPLLETCSSNDLMNMSLSSKKEALLAGFSWLNVEKCDEATYATSGWIQFLILLQRSFLLSVRNKKALALQALHYLLNGILIGLVFYDNANDGSMMYNHLKFCVGIVLFFSHTRMFIPVILFPTEVKRAKKEHFNRWYGTFPFYVATLLANIPIHFFFNFVYISIVYYLSGLPRDLWRFLMYLVIGNFVSLSTEGIGLAVGSVFNALNGSIIAPSLTVPFLCLAIYGFDFAKQISPLMRVIMRTSPMRCGLAAFVIVTFGFGRPTLNCDDVYCHFADPKILLEYLDGTDNQLYTELAALIANIIFYRIVAYYSLKKRFTT